jgi:hypothetical protein
MLAMPSCSSGLDRRTRHPAPSGLIGLTCNEVQLLDDVPAVLTPSRRRRCRPGKVDADKAYDSATNRAYLRRHGITPRIARRGVESSSRLEYHRWRIEPTLSWLSCYRRLGVRWDRGSERSFGFVLLACGLVCFNRLQPP